MSHKSSGGFTLIELMIVVVIIGILAAIAIPNFIITQDRAKETALREPARKLGLAANDFAAQNNGVFAKSLNDTTLSGATLLSLMPSGSKYKDPFTGKMIEPVDGVASVTGQIGYEPRYECDKLVGYTITVWGKYTNVFNLTSEPVSVGSAVVAF